MAEAKQALRVVKKKWLPIKASKFFDYQFLGECYVASPEQLAGRTLAANLANLTGDIRQQSVTLKFLVTSVDGNAGIADVVSYAMAPSAVKRVVRKGADRIDESFVCETMNGQKVKVKPMLITKAATKSSVHRLLRKALVASITNQVKMHSFESLINELIPSKLQTELKGELKKIYPVKTVEVRVLQLVGQAVAGAQDAAVTAETETAKEASEQQQQ